MLAFSMHGGDAAIRTLLGALEIPTIAVSLGDTSTLADPAVFALHDAVESLDSDAAREWYADLYEQEQRGTFLAVATGLGAVGVVRA